MEMPPGPDLTSWVWVKLIGPSQSLLGNYDLSNRVPIHDKGAIKRRYIYSMDTLQ